MIKIIFNQEAYYYNTGSQPYNIETNIELDNDIGGKEAITAFIRMLNIATYRIDLKVLKELVQELEDYGYSDGERIM